MDRPLLVAGGEARATVAFVDVFLVQRAPKKMIDGYFFGCSTIIPPIAAIRFENSSLDDQGQPVPDSTTKFAKRSVGGTISKVTDVAD